MNKPSIKTDAQQIVIAGIRSHVEDAFRTLQAKADEIELLESTENTKDLLLVIKLRLDVLTKIDFLLLKPTQEIYEKLENEVPEPGELSNATQSISSALQRALLQGIE